ncbi:hypothetical protein LIER_20522 [Lithospermum erythrorhizon]|uniref:Uncharacterized protein n=1 Tax=Lithospermum erythrorhizon TaxID=34254 RepID=A0AAV3QPW8_LITER
MADLFQSRFKGLDSRSFRLWAVCIWDIWYQRNLLIHNKDIRQPSAVVDFARGFLGSTENAALILSTDGDHVSIVVVAFLYVMLVSVGNH